MGSIVSISSSQPVAKKELFLVARALCLQIVAAPPAQLCTTGILDFTAESNTDLKSAFLRQPRDKDESIMVADFLKQSGKKLGTTIDICTAVLA